MSKKLAAKMEVLKQLMALADEKSLEGAKARKKKPKVEEPEEKASDDKDE